jgi:L-lactate dehydrogenase complex protein LldG
MTSKHDILTAIARHPAPAAELPDLSGPWIAFPDRLQQFADVLSSVGGRAVRVTNLDELNRTLEELPAYANAARICSLVAGVGRSNVDLDSIADPHALADVDFTVLSGEIGVAENAAVWVTDARLKHRVLPFITQHLALVISADQVVDTLHAAYERIAFSGPGFGVFISGPSKTADIEQSLVIGAHGARSLTVFVLDG